MRGILKLVVICVLLQPAAAFPAENGLTVKGVRFSTYPSFTRVVVEIEAAAPYVLNRTADNRGLLLAAYDGPLTMKSPLLPMRDAVVSGVELKEEAGRAYLLIRLENMAGEVKDFVLRGPDRIVLDISRGPVPSGVIPRADSQRVIVLDPGHGGKDTGVVTSQGQEKTFTLDLALAIRKNLQKNPRFRTILTRDKDQTLTLDERAIAANAAGAAVFVSIHAAPGANARVFIRDLADDAGVRTGRPASGDFLGFEAGSEQQAMAWGIQQASHTRESGDLGRVLAQRLGENAGGAFQAPLAGLKAVDAAAVVVEVGMALDRERIATAIAGGIEQHAGEDR